MYPCALQFCVADGLGLAFAEPIQTLGSCVGVTVGAVVSETSVIVGASVPELVITSRVAVSEKVVVVVSEMFVIVGAVGLEMSVFVEGGAVADSTSELE